MGFLDFIRELRTGEPSPKKAAKAMKFLGWVSLLGGLWNFILPQVAPFKETNFHFPTHFPYVALIGFWIIGALFFLSARGIEEMESWGKRVGQAAITLLLVGIFFLSALIMPEFGKNPSTNDPFKIVFYIFFAIALAQFVLPAYFGIRYLGRLPVKGDPYSTIHYNPDEIARSISERMHEGATTLHDETKYKDSPLPFGLLGTFALLIAVPLLIIFIVEKYAGPEVFALLLPLVILFIFIGPISFNYLSSPFRKNRKIIATFTGGGSIFLFQGSWPFFRLLVYHDALEVRVMFHRFLIPYDKMEDIPGNVGFFSTGILIKSDIPDVPSSIRFGGFGLKKIARVVSETRKSYLLALQMPGVNRQ